MKFLKESKHILADGTFKSAPRPFTQVYVLHGTGDTFVIPVVWAFLGSKTEKNYTKFFQILKEKIAEKFGFFVPEFILTDFETAIIPTIKTIFPYRLIWDAGSISASVYSGKFKNLGWSENIKLIVSSDL